MFSGVLFLAAVCVFDVLTQQGAPGWRGESGGDRIQSYKGRFDIVRRDDRLKALIEPVVTAFGCELWGLEFSAAGRHGLLRVYIDKPDGIGIQDCERVSRQLGSLLDVENPIAGEYTLEVSSPGLDRPLYELDQFRQFVGSDINLRLRTAFEGRRKFQGRLVAVEKDEIVIVVDDHEYLFPHAGVERASVVPQFGNK